LILRIGENQIQTAGKSARTSIIDAIGVSIIIIAMQQSAYALIFGVAIPFSSKNIAAYAFPGTTTVDHPKAQHYNPLLDSAIYSQQQLCYTCRECSIIYLVLVVKGVAIFS